MFRSLPNVSFCSVFRRCPEAVAHVTGSAQYPAVRGTVRFYQTVYGVVVAAEMFGLPVGSNGESVFGFHVHSGGECQGTEPFMVAAGHYDPVGRLHPYHAGDLPPLFGTVDGYAFSVFLTDRFSVNDVKGRTVILHAMPDDFTSQPAGNAGGRIACGEIR